jgi:hypothetical protein
MKKHLHLIVAAALSVGMGLAFQAAAPSPLKANTTTMQAPGNAGRPMADSITGARAEVRLERGIGDCSNTAALTALSSTSQPINVTSVAKLSPSGSTPYPGVFHLTVVNLGPSDAVVYVNTTATAIITTTCPAGVRVLANTSQTITLASRDGLTAHAQGVSATALLAYTICSN